MAADVSGDVLVNTVDLIAIQRFFLGLTTGIANTGKYQFSPASRSYPVITSNQATQNYDTLVFGDVVSPFAERASSPSPTGVVEDKPAGEVLPTVTAITLPEVTIDRSQGDFNTAVTTTVIDAKNNLVGFQGDFTFDQRVITFQSEPVQKAGITGGNWSVSGNVLAGTGPIRTLRISAYSLDFKPLAGSGTLFELRMARVSQAAQSAPLSWSAPPNQFIFIDADLKTQPPGKSAPGTVTSSLKRN